MAENRVPSIGRIDDFNNYQPRSCFTRLQADLGLLKSVTDLVVSTGCYFNSSSFWKFKISTGDVEFV